ncbi:uncharacterized protein G2W53_040891 [Senna tora]|uniref:Uncharacterized protein n=1 Tax=Senna tora TaxID=362788 RepID=A0A834SG62_9FABA|nr:uncharacterized protein G2W53_040891 [Senna tora]
MGKNLGSEEDTLGDIPNSSSETNGKVKRALWKEGQSQGLSYKDKLLCINGRGNGIPSDKDKKDDNNKDPDQIINPSVSAIPKSFARVEIGEEAFGLWIYVPRMYRRRNRMTPGFNTRTIRDRTMVILFRKRIDLIFFKPLSKQDINDDTAMDLDFDSHIPPRMEPTIPVSQPKRAHPTSMPKGLGPKPKSKKVEILPQGSRKPSGSSVPN